MCGCGADECAGRHMTVPIDPQQPRRSLMDLRKSIGVISLLLVYAVAPALSQTGRGTLTGSVADTRGAVLQGAKISGDPGGATALSDQTDQFTLSGLAAGETTVTVTYAGFSPSVQKVTLIAGQIGRAARKERVGI